jgi:hypothetical protein
MAHNVQAPIGGILRVLPKVNSVAAMGGRVVGECEGGGGGRGGEELERSVAQRGAVTTFLLASPIQHSIRSCTLNKTHGAPNFTRELLNAVSWKRLSEKEVMLRRESVQVAPSSEEVRMEQKGPWMHQFPQFGAGEGHMP